MFLTLLANEVWRRKNWLTRLKRVFWGAAPGLVITKPGRGSESETKPVLTVSKNKEVKNSSAKVEGSKLADAIRPETWVSVQSVKELKLGKRRCDKVSLKPGSKTPRDDLPGGGKVAFFACPNGFNGRGYFRQFWEN